MTVFDVVASPRTSGRWVVTVLGASMFTEVGSWDEVEAAAHAAVASWLDLTPNEVTIQIVRGREIGDDVQVAGQRL